MKIKLILFTLLALGSFLSSCKKSDTVETALEHNLLKSSEKYNELLNNRETRAKSFIIENIRRNNDVLTITVKGGYKAEDFYIVWDGSILFSYPGQVNLVLYSDKLEGCDTENRFDVLINLENIIGNHDAKDFIFNIANGSVKQDKSLNPNGVVSSN